MNGVSEIELAQNSTLGELVAKAYAEGDQLAMAICLNVRCDLQCALGGYLWSADDDVDNDESMDAAEKEFIRSIQKLMREFK